MFIQEEAVLQKLKQLISLLSKNLISVDSVHIQSLLQLSSLLAGRFPSTVRRVAAQSVADERALRGVLLRTLVAEEGGDEVFVGREPVAPQIHPFDVGARTELASVLPDAQVSLRVLLHLVAHHERLAALGALEWPFQRVRELDVVRQRRPFEEAALAEVAQELPVLLQIGNKQRD